MSEYFHIEPLGRGTINIESLYSYIGRIAVAHSVGVFQFLKSLDHWASRNNVSETRIGKYMLSGVGLPLCRHGDTVQNLVEILEAATGCHSLRSTTFLALSGITTVHASGLLKRSRTWCPACLRDDLKSGQGAYDRLYWVAKHVERCVEHQIQLESTCPQCGKPQWMSLRAGLTHCRLCGTCIISPDKSWIRRPNPSFGETEVLGLINRIAADPKLRFERNAYQRFICALRSRHVDSLFGASGMRLYQIDPTHLKTDTPGLNTFLRLATTFSIPLLSILEDPEGAVSQVSPTLVEHPPLPCIPRVMHSKTYRLSLGRMLVRAIRQIRKGRILSLKQVCERAGVTKGYAWHNFPTLCARITDGRIALVERERRMLRKRVQTTLKSGIYKRYLTGDIRTHDDLIAEIVRLHGASFAMVRVELHDYLYSSRARKKAMVRRNRLAAKARVIVMKRVARGNAPIRK